MNNIDVLKYGFVDEGVNEFESHIYTKKTNIGVFKLSINLEVVCFDLTANGRNIVIANRYKVNTQDEMDFLITNACRYE